MFKLYIYYICFNFYRFYCDHSPSLIFENSSNFLFIYASMITCGNFLWSKLSEMKRTSKFSILIENMSMSIMNSVSVPISIYFVVMLENQILSNRIFCFKHKINNMKKNLNLIYLSDILSWVDKEANNGPSFHRTFLCENIGTSVEYYLL